MSSLSIEGLAVGYRGTAVLAGLAAWARSGELTVLLGPNGAGKSTLLRTLACLQRPLAGTVRLDGADLLALPAAERALRLAVVLTERVDPGLLTGRELVALGRHPHSGSIGRLRAVDEAAIDTAVRAVGAEHLAARRVAELSDGERQRILTARALAQEPAVLLLDEPSAFLDVSSRVALLGLLRELARDRGLIVVVSTHDLELALRLADHVWLIDPAGGLRTGSPEELVADGTVAGVFDTPVLAFDPVPGTFVVGNGADRGRAVVVADQPHRALVGRALARHGWSTVPDGPAEAEVEHLDGARFTVRQNGRTTPADGWAALRSWAERAPAPDGLHRAPRGALAAALRAAASVGAYFALETGHGHPGPGWVRLDEIYCGDGTVLTEHVTSVGTRLGTDEPRVAASVFFLGLAARLVSPLLAAAARGLLLDLDPATTHVQSRPGEALGLRTCRLGGWEGDIAPALVAHVLVEQHLAPLVAAVRRTTPVATGLLWGNAASALAGALAVLERHMPAPRARQIVTALLDTGPLAGTGTLTDDGFRRRSCCLYYRTPATRYCGDCALHPDRTPTAATAGNEEEP